LDCFYTFFYVLKWGKVVRFRSGFNTKMTQINTKIANNDEWSEGNKKQLLTNLSYKIRGFYEWVGRSLFSYLY